MFDFGKGADEKRPLLQHLEELLVRLRRCVFWIMGGAVAGYLYSGQMIRFLEQPLIERLPSGGHLVYTAPFEKIWIYLRVSLFAGFFVVSPFVGREIAKFLRPALKRVERRGIGAFLGSFFFAFLIGLFLGYRYVLPLVIDTALRFGTGYEQPFLTVSSYINVCLGILIFSGLMVEIPIAMSHLSAWGWIKASVWAKGRRISIVVNAVVSAILSPPDAMSMVLMMIPLQFLYESGIWGARVAEWWFYARSRNHREIATP